VAQPIRELAASSWSEAAIQSLQYDGLVSASHSDTEFQALLKLGHRNLLVAIGLDDVDGSSLRATTFGDGHELRHPNSVPIPNANSRLYMQCRNSGGDYLVRRLAQIPFNDDSDAALWLNTVSDAFETLQPALLQVWNIETGELEAIVTWSGSTVQLQELLPSFALRKSQPITSSDSGIGFGYDVDANLHICRGPLLRHVSTLGPVPPDRRPSPSTRPDAIVTHGELCRHRVNV
jgi:hypothetical protein